MKSTQLGIPQYFVLMSSLDFFFFSYKYNFNSRLGSDEERARERERWRDIGTLVIELLVRDEIRQTWAKGLVEPKDENIICWKGDVVRGGKLASTQIGRATVQMWPALLEFTVSIPRISRPKESYINI